MSESKPSARNGEEASRPRGSDLSRGPEAQAQEHTPSWLNLGAMLVWQVGKRLLGALLRERVAESALDIPVQETETPPNGSVRADDRNLTLESETSLFSRRRWGTFLANCFFVAGFCGGLGFLFVYWTGAGNEALGAWLAVFFAGLSAGLVVSAHLLAVHREATARREDLEPPPHERAATEEDFRRGELDLHRRGLLKWVTAIGSGTVAVMFVSLLRSLLPDPDPALYSTVWKRGQRLMSLDGKPVKADAVPPGGTTIVFPEDNIGREKAQTVLVRVSPHLLELPGDRAGWAPLGNLAFSRVCTHAGCPVGMYEKTAHLLMCPCHQSTFDVLRAAQPTGGPAARALPQLPLYVDADGFLCAGGGFSEPPGPGFWGMPS